MTVFLLGCTALIFLSGVFYLKPGIFRGDQEKTTTDLNVEWFRQREQELLDEGDETLMGDAQARLLDDLAGDAPEASGETLAGDLTPFRAWLLLPIVALASSVLYFVLGAAPDVVISRQLEAVSDASTPQQMAEVIETIEKRSLQRPQNLHYRSLLGRYYMGQEDYSRAAATYQSLAQAASGDPQVLAFAAQAGYLANDRQLSEQGRLQAEQALAIDPTQRTALGLLGMSLFEQGQFGPAISYWQRLLALEPPNSESAQMIAGIIERARQQIAGIAGDTSGPPADETTLKGVTVNVSLPAGATVADTDTVFVLARATHSNTRMPIAVKRLAASQLPVSLRLDDSSSMAGQKMSQANSVIVVVQVSPEGKPGAANASWLGDGGPVTPSLDSAPVDIILRRATEG